MLEQRIGEPPERILKSLDHKPEFHSSQHAEDVEVNTFRRRKTLTLRMNGRQQEWFSVKGGASEKKFAPNATPTYEICYNPVTGEWLKMLPALTPEQRATIPIHLEQLDKQLRLGVTMQKRAMELAGVGHLAHQLRLETVTLPDGAEQIAFISPHFGDSLEYCFIESLPGRKKPEKITFHTLHDDVKAWAQKVYHAVFQDAVALYLRYGYWTEDPNPGNILFHRVGKGDTSEMFPFLIDLTSSRQHIEVPTRKPNESTSDYSKRLYEHYNTHIGELSAKFGKKCKTWGIDFAVNQVVMKGINAEIERLVAAA